MYILNYFSAGTMKEQSDNERRSFLKWLLGLGFFGWLGTVFYPLFRYLVPPEIPEANISSLKVGFLKDFTEGTGYIFQFGRKPGILIRLNNGQFKAFSATCTHLSCIVQYRKDLNQIWCACHNGRFDLTGRNVSGPPPKPLDEFDVNIKGDEVWVTKRA